MDIKKLQERIEKAEEKLLKLEKTLSKHLIKLQKKYDKYAKKDDALHEVIPVDLFVKFDTHTHYTWKQDNDLADKMSKKYNIAPVSVPVFIHNQEATEKLLENHELIKTNFQIYNVLHKYLYDTEEIVNQIVRKREEINETKARLEEYKKTLQEATKKKNDVEILFQKVPALKKFIEKCGETQYAFLLNYYKGIKEAWDRYHKMDREACDLWNTGYHYESTKLHKEAIKIRPRVFPKNDEQIKKEVEHWKDNESKLMAERIKTEFGDIVETILYLGADGNVNGIIKGTDKTAHINTIFAGGYNIQCLHTRLLVHEK